MFHSLVESVPAGRLQNESIPRSSLKRSPRVDNFDITSCVAPWSHVPFGGSAYRGGDLLPGGQHPVGFASRESSSRGVCLQPPPHQKSGRYASYLECFLAWHGFSQVESSVIYNKNGFMEILVPLFCENFLVNLTCI